MAYTSTNANLRSSFQSLMKKRGEVRKMYYDVLKDGAPIYTNFCSVDNSSAAYEIENVVGGRGAWTKTVYGALGSVTGEGAEYTFADMAQGTEITYSHMTYRDAFDVSEEQAEDNQIKSILGNAKEMAMGGRYVVESVATDILDNAFTSGTGSDGVYLCASNHNLVNSASTGDNAETAVLGVDGLEAMQLLADNMVDEAGLFVNVKYDTLIVPPALRRDAEELVGSDKTPENNNNAKNIYAGKYRVIVNPHLASSTAWFLVASANSAELKPRFYWRTKPQFKMDFDVYSDNVLFKARERFSAGFTSWQHIVGSTGAGA